MIVVTLWLLATLDGAFAAYREAAGRNALIRKRAYYRRAMFKGALAAQVAVVIAAAFMFLTLAISDDPQKLFRGYQYAGSRMLIVYLPYAAIIMLAFLARTIRSVDIRSITSTTIFGPFTLIRPLVATAGLIFGVWGAPRIEIVILGAIVLIMMLLLEKALFLLRPRMNYVSNDEPIR